MISAQTPSVCRARITIRIRAGNSDEPSGVLRRVFFAEEESDANLSPDTELCPDQGCNHPCSHRGVEMQPALLAPHKRRLKKLTFACSRCEPDETFLAAPK